MSRSGVIRVLKRDGSVEAFEEGKLAGAMYAAMEDRCGTFEDARELARAVKCYLHRTGWPCVASAAVFEMAVKVLRRVRLEAAARAMERHRQRRKARRRLLRVIHDRGQMTAWDKSWLAKIASRSWHVSPKTGRILAGQVERIVLTRQQELIPRAAVIDLLNQCVVEYGLADAVPVERPAETV